MNAVRPDTDAAVVRRQDASSSPTTTVSINQPINALLISWSKHNWVHPGNTRDSRNNNSMTSTASKTRCGRTTRHSASCTSVAACSVHNAENCTGLRHSELDVQLHSFFSKLEHKYLNTILPHFCMTLGPFLNVAKYYSFKIPRLFVSRLKSRDLVQDSQQSLGSHFS